MTAGSERVVSVIVPCRNECDHIDAFCTNLLAQALPAPWRLQAVLADGMSDDGTRERLAGWQQREPRLVVIDNPARIVSTALNRAIEQAAGEVIVRMDVHTRYAADYVEQCLIALETTGATCVGGAWRPLAQSGCALAIARAFASRFGSGGAASRRVDYNGAVDTVYLGAWRRTELLRVGGFDETLVRNQDDELNLRIVRSGGRVWQSAAIRSWYTPRASFAALFRQFYQYGYWKVPVIRKHRLPASPRHLAPFGLAALLVMLVAAGLAWPPAWLLGAGLLLLYGGAALTSAAFGASPLREPGQWLAVAWALACMHGGYALGFGRGLLDFGLLRRAPRASATELTR